MIEDRRKFDDEFKIKINDLKKQVDHLVYYLQSEFGGTDLAGNKTEGNIHRVLRYINEKLEKQNGKVATLEKKVLMLPCEKRTISTDKDFASIYNSIKVIQGFIFALVLAMVVEVWVKK